jgi:cytochrome c biogenesis protein CcmG, thiol:disulfide interchange protein DsbE
MNIGGTLLCLVLFGTTGLGSTFALAQQDEVSDLIGRSVPQFNLPAAIAGRPGLARDGFRQGQPRVLNFFGSWCVPCRKETPVLLAMARRGVPIDGIALRDHSEALRRYFAELGNPYQRIGLDMDGRVAERFGGIGVPQTFIIDGSGVIRYHFVGDLAREDVPDLIAALRAAR